MQGILYKKCFFCLHNFPLTVVCSLPLHSFSPHSPPPLSLSLSRLCTEKGQTFSPILFSYWCESQKLKWILVKDCCKPGKESWARSSSVQRTDWFNLEQKQEQLMRYLTCTTTPVVFQILSNWVFDGEYMHLKFIFQNSSTETLKYTYASDISDWFNHRSFF